MDNVAAAILIFYLLALFGCFWGSVRAFRYYLGKHSDYIHASPTTWIMPICGIWLSWACIDGFYNVETTAMKYGIKIDHSLSLFGWFIVIGLLGFLKQSLLDLKTSESLMKKRDQIIKDIEPSVVVDATDQLIIDKELMADEWVSNTWNKLNKSDWIDRLSSNPSLLQDILQKKLQINAKDLEPYADWTSIIQHFCYLEEKDQANNRSLS